MAKTLTAKDVEQIMLIAQGVVSLNTPVSTESGEEDAEIGDFLEDPDADVEANFLCTARGELLRKIMADVLVPRELEIIRRRYGFDCEPMTLEELGQEMAITRERVRQLEAKGLRKLRMYFARKKLTEVDI